MAPKYVTSEECGQKPHISKGTLITFATIVLTLFGLFVALLSYTSQQTWAATAKVDQVADQTKTAIDRLQQTFHVNETALKIQQERYDTLARKLDDICDELKAQRIEQQKLLEKIIERQK
jgi:predicted PurR-regulated permease PerM